MNESGEGLVIAADLGGTYMRVASVDAGGRIVERLKRQTPQGGKVEDIMRALVGAARDCGSGASVRSVSVVVPGEVRAGEGVVVKAPNLPCLDGFHLGAALESELGYTVMLENDANAAAVGELWLGAGRGQRSLICLTLGTGVGGGVILDGKLWRGIDGSAGELGHIGVEPFGADCPCGSRGCLEVYASATAIVRMTCELRAQYPQSTLHAIEELTARSIFERGVEGDELAREAFRRMGFYLGVGLASLVNILNPEIIVIGGGVAAGWELFYQHAREQLDRRAFPVPARRVQVVRAQLGDDAGLLGAAHIAFESAEEG